MHDELLLKKAQEMHKAQAMRQAHDFQTRVLLAQLAATIAGQLMATDYGFAMQEAFSKADRDGHEEGTPLEVQFDSQQSLDQALGSAEYILRKLGILPPAASPQ